MRIVLLVCLCCYYALASGFKISEQSLNATALSSAYVAHLFKFKAEIKMRIVLLVCLCCYYALASGFKISEQSLNATALSSAYVAGAFGADSAYYNPANMGFTHQLSSNDKSELELTLTGIYIPGFSFTTDTGRKDIGQGSINWG